jgi:hypothetical protein
MVIKIFSGGNKISINTDAFPMNKSFLWQLYITFHTVILGVPFLFFPNKILPVLGFESTDEPWIRVAGILFLAIGASSYSVYKEKIREMIIPSIRVRTVIVITLIIVAISSNQLFLYILAGIILVGVIGSAASYHTDFNRSISSMSK